MSKLNLHDFAIMGGQAALKSKLPVGQLYWPEWDEYVAGFKGIFDRDYFTNQGPLVQELELRLQDYLGVKHVICVVNATVGLIMALEALGLKGKVVVPSFTFIASVQAITWAGLTPVFCDVDPRTHSMTVEQIEKVIDPNVSAILPVNLWGGTCLPDVLEDYARKRNISILFDSAHSFGVEYQGESVGGWGDAEVFSFHATKVFSTGEGGCIATNNDLLAKKLRNIRSSYGAGEPIEVIKTSNGRMSEAQACIGLLNLQRIDSYIQNNKKIFAKYNEIISKIKGLKIVEPSGVSHSNYQYVNLVVDEGKFGLSRDALMAVLAAENVDARRYFYPGVHNSNQYLEISKLADLRNTELLNNTLIQLPTGALVTPTLQDKICQLLIDISEFSVKLNAGRGA